MSSWEMDAVVEITIDHDEEEFLRDKTLEVVWFDSPALVVADTPVDVYVQRSVHPTDVFCRWRVSVIVRFDAEETHVDRVAGALDGQLVAYHGGEALLCVGDSTPELVDTGDRDG